MNNEDASATNGSLPWVRPAGKPRKLRRLGLALIVYFLALALWLGIEDSSLVYVLALGAGGATLAVWHAAQGWPASSQPASIWGRLLRFGLIGLGAGALAPVLAVGLIVVKISLHGHVIPDFSLAEIMGLFWRAPVWAGAGALAGVGLGLLKKAILHSNTGK